MATNNLVKVGELDTLTIEENAYAEYLELLAKVKPLNERIAEIENQIKAELKELVSETTKVNDLTFTVSGGFWSFEFDLEKFKKENFVLYVKYLKPKQSKETFGLKKGVK